MALKQDIKDLRVLFAEDDPINFIYLEKLTKFCGTENFKGFYNGKQLAEEFQNNQNYDVIIVDIQMPIMNGIDCLREIRKINQEIPVIALTAYALKTDRDKYIKLGFNGYLAKPVSKEDFISAINELV